MDNLDPKVVALTRAIKQTETGNNPDAYNATGASGEHGAYQFMPDTYKVYAQKYLGDANAQPTVENQNKIAYSFVKEQKDAGKNPAQIASMWNAGQGEPDAYKGTFSNGKPSKDIRRDAQGNPILDSKGQPISFDVPGYAAKVSQAYEQFKGQTGSVSDATTNTQDNEPSLGNKLIGRTNDAGTAVQQGLSGQINPASAVLQTVGAGAGMIGDVTNSAVELVPGVKQVENLIGQGVGALAKTSVGQSVVKSISDFSQAHPELSKDIGAGFNIATAIPIFKGLGAIKDVAMDAGSQALKGVAEKSMTEDLTTAITRTKGGRTFLENNPDALKTLVDERAIPDVAEGKYTTKDAEEKLNQSISDIEDNELQPLLDNNNSPAISQRMPLETARQEAKNSAIQGLKDTAPVDAYFDRIKAKYGDYPTLQQLNEAKRTVSKNITEDGFNSPTYSTDKVVRAALQKSVEDGANTLGLGDVAAVNQKIARLIKAQNALGHIDRKPIKVGLFGGLAKEAATAAGEAAGNMVGVPIAGAYAVHGLTSGLLKKLGNITPGILKRTGKDAAKTSLKSTAKNVTKGFLGVQAQKQNQ